MMMNTNKGLRMTARRNMKMMLSIEKELRMQA